MESVCSSTVCTKSQIANQRFKNKRHISQVQLNSSSHLNVNTLQDFVSRTVQSYMVRTTFKS